MGGSRLDQWVKDDIDPSNCIVGAVDIVIHHSYREKWRERREKVGE